MDRFEALQRLDAELDGGGHRKRAHTTDPVAQVLAVNVFPDHVEAAVGKRREVVEDGDVGVLDLGGEPGLAHEALLRRGIGCEVLAQDLDDPQLLQVKVADRVDLSHAGGAQALDDLIFAVEDRPRLPGVQTDSSLYISSSSFWRLALNSSWLINPSSARLFNCRSFSATGFAAGPAGAGAAGAGAAGAAAAGAAMASRSMPGSMAPRPAPMPIPRPAPTVL